MILQRHCARVSSFATVVAVVVSSFGQLISDLTQIQKFDDSGVEWSGGDAATSRNYCVVRKIEGGRERGMEARAAAAAAAVSLYESCLRYKYIVR